MEAKRKRHVLYDCIYMANPEQAKLRSRKISGCQGLGMGMRRGRGVTANEYGVSF